MSVLNSLYQKVTKRTAKKRTLFFLAADAVLISFSLWLAFLMRFDGEIPGQYFTTLFWVAVLALLFCLPVFYRQRLYSFSWSYVSANELISLIKATTLSFLFLGTVLYFLRERPIFAPLAIFPRSTLFIGYFLVLFFTGGFRFSKRLYLELFPAKPLEGKERTLIVGAGDAGEQILRSIQAAKNKSPYLPAGFVDDNPFKQGVIIHGLKVLGRIDDIPQIIKRNQLDGMIIALPTAGSATIKKAVEKGREAGLKKIKVVPSMAEIINGQVSLRDLKEPRIEDLLAREPVSLDLKTIEDFIAHRIVLVTGAAGSIGSELSRQAAKFKPSKLLLLDQEETGIFNLSEELKEKFKGLSFSSIVANIQDKEKINYVFSKHRPDIVFHAAAYKHVPVMEEHCDEAVKNNIFGTATVAKAALLSGVEKFVFISTDKSINPTSVMGATKRVGEMICQALNEKNQTRFVSVRFGNVLDSRGNVISLFKRQIKRGGPVKITHPEMKRYFMTCPEACLLVMQAGSMGEGGKVFVLDMGKPVRIVDLAKEMIRLSGFEPDKDIPIVFTRARPGEKLFEEILTAEEGTIATHHHKIFTAKLSGVDEEKLNFALTNLKKAVQDSDGKKIKLVLKDLIPSYQPFF